MIEHYEQFHRHRGGNRTGQLVCVFLAFGISVSLIMALDVDRQDANFILLMCARKDRETFTRHDGCSV